MLTPYADCAQRVSRLHQAAVELHGATGLLQLPPLVGREWYELLTKKLLPQLTDDAFLVVAVVGGTNIGKSVVFNHIAGSRASATSPLASGTKHPVCLVPERFTERHDLSSIFPGFALHAGAACEESLEEHDEDRLFWRHCAGMPDNLLVLDTPDIDSDAKMNWRRADHIRHCSDVLIAVLTQQKYNDAAVKQFFRKAASEDKAVLIVFNQVQLSEDEAYWPMWLDTFCRETNIVPEFVYIAPNDRRAAEECRLPFWERTPARSTNRDSSHQPVDVPVQTETLTQHHAPFTTHRSPLTKPHSPSPTHQTPLTKHPLPAATIEVSRSLSRDLSQLHFEEIKVRTLRGSLNQLLHGDHGIPAYLAQIEQRSREFRSAADLLAAHQLAEIDDWPSVSNKVLVAEIRNWWQSQREGWSAKVHNFYNAVGSKLALPFRYVHGVLVGEQTPPWELYRQQEWSTILAAVEKVYQKLEWFSELGNPLLQPRLQALLGGTSRAELLRRLHTELDAIDLPSTLHDLVSSEMQAFRSESPQFYQLLKRLDAVAAAARPATSIVLFVTGFGPAGNIAGHFVANTAMQSAVHLAGDLAGGTIAAAVGETAISSTTATGVGIVEAKFRKLHLSFTAQRAGWLAQMLKQHLLGRLPDDLRQAAEVPNSSAFHDARNAIASLRERLTYGS